MGPLPMFLMVLRQRLLHTGAKQSAEFKSDCNMIDFIIMGAQKSGTTAAAHNLNKHPEISIFSDVTEYGQREIEFFNQHWNRGKDWYFNQLPKEGIVGEKTAELFHRTVCHERIKMVNPNVKLVILLRNPVDRAYSQWKMAALNKKDEVRSFEDVVMEELNQIDNRNYRDSFYQLGSRGISCWREGYLLKGFYAEQLDNVYQLFLKEQVFVGIAENFHQFKTESYNKIFSFLGVSPFKTVFEDKFIGQPYEPMSDKLKGILIEIYKS